MKKTIITTTLILLFSLSAFAQRVEQPKQDTATYLLVGKLNDFKLLFATITTPDDVTVNQKKAVAEWVNKGLQMIPPKKDSTTNKPKTK